MAVANTKSTLITNADATTPTLSAAHLGGLQRPVGVVEVAAADDDTSVYRFFRVHSSDRIHQLLLLNDAITAGTAYHVGLHQTAANGGAAADEDLFATSVDLSSARVAPLDVLHEALNIDKAEKQIWELLGLSSDPGRDYDVTMTGATVGSAAGTIVLKAVTVGARS